jgi:hypothetical protein
MSLAHLCVLELMLVTGHENGVSSSGILQSAENLGNYTSAHQRLRLLKISFNSFRHWGRSMTGHYTNGNVLTGRKLLRHKKMGNTMKYINMIHFEDDKFEVTTATTVDEAKQALSAGFNYINKKNDAILFRRPKVLEFKRTVRSLNS